VTTGKTLSHAHILSRMFCLCVASAAGRAWCAATVLALLLLVWAPHAAAGPEPALPILNVVLIDGQDVGRPLLQQFQNELRQALSERTGGRLAMYLESADVSRFPGADLSLGFDQWLQRKYADKKIDLIIASANLPLERVLSWRTSVWKGAPLVIGLLDPARAARLPAEPGVSALLWVPSVDRTMELVRTAFPSTQKILLVGGSDYGDLAGELIRQQLEARSGMEVVDTGRRPVAELEDYVTSLAGDTAVFYTAVYSDSAGQGYQPRQVLALLSKRSSRPIVGLSPTYIGYGLLGGDVIDVASYARQLVDLGWRVKDNPGVFFPAVPLSEQEHLTVDYRQLHRWNVPVDQLPLGTTVLFQPLTLWQEHQASVVMVAVIGTFLTLALFALLVERARRRDAEQGLKALSSQLLTSQEVERDRIAKDLHDDVNQRLALLALGLDGIASSAAANLTLAKRAGELGEEVRQLSSDVHAIALQLRPPELDAMGLPSALRSLGLRMQERAGVKVDVIESAWPKHLSSDIEIVLYRVVQEALQNVNKHSGAASVRIVLAVSRGDVEVSILDDGKGIDVDHVDAGEKLGLIGMRERLALVRGRLEVQRRAEAGTWVAARVPLPRTATG